MSGRMNRFLLGLATSAALLLPGRCLGAKVVLPSPGDIGFAGFAQYGTLLNQGEIGEQFGSGPGFGVRLRYRMRYERGLGLTFERQGFDPREIGRGRGRVDVAAVAARHHTREIARVVEVRVRDDDAREGGGIEAKRAVHAFGLVAVSLVEAAVEEPRARPEPQPVAGARHGARRALEGDAQPLAHQSVT